MRCVLACVLSVGSIAANAAVAQEALRPKEPPSGVLLVFQDVPSPEMPELQVDARVDFSPLTEAELEGFRQQVAQCWNVSDARAAVVSVRFSMDQRGKPDSQSLELIGAGKDTSDAVKSAYTAAKRAIIRCGAKGYKLPLEKYELWRDTELTFNPERMSLR